MLTATGLEQQEGPCGAAGTSVLGQRQWTLQVGLAQSSMASSWSARASNMVLMSSRMCLVEVLGGLQGEHWVRSASNQIARQPWARAVAERRAGAKCFPRRKLSLPYTRALGLK